MKEEQKKGKKTISKRSYAGLGLFAGEYIAKKDFIIEYVGEIIDKKESDRRGGKYLFETSKNRVIDGKDRSNKARYINHSCNPNCEVRIERGHINVYAIKDIALGEELGYDYGKEYCDEFCTPCLCHACRKA